MSNQVMRLDIYVKVTLILERDRVRWVKRIASAQSTRAK
jgi:hypothetical protein